MLRKLYLMFFNFVHGTEIHSVRASLKADYGKNVRVGYNTVVADDVTIGNYSYVNENSSIENCDIGNYCSISEGVHISPFEHPLFGYTTHPVGYSDDYIRRKRKRTIIGNDVLISLNVVVLEGCVIGDGAVIGAGAVVTHDIAPYEIVGGVPARHIRYRIDGKYAEYLRGTYWWNLDIEKLKKREMELYKK